MAPAGPAVGEFQAGETGHEVQFWRPAVAEGDRKRPHHAVAKNEHLCPDRLVCRVMNRGVEPKVRVVEGHHAYGLVAVAEADDIRHEALKHEESGRFERGRNVAEAIDLPFLAPERKEGVEHNKHEPVGTAEGHGCHVAHRDGHFVAPGLGAEALDHRRRSVDAADVNAPNAQGKRNTAGSDPELECRSTVREFGEKRNGRLGVHELMLIVIDVCPHFAVRIGSHRLSHRDSESALWTSTQPISDQGRSLAPLSPIAGTTTASSSIMDFVPDQIFANPRLAALYDVLDGDRSDLDVYVGIVDELEASSVLDVGCGTGTLACRLAQRGMEVVGLDPASASLDIARRKPGAERVRWIAGDGSSIPPLGVDLAVMTGNVAQVFVTDAEWTRVLGAIWGAVRDQGWLTFETRDPAGRAWERWTKEHTFREVLVPEVGLVTTWTELVHVNEPLVSFRHVFRFAQDGSEVISDSTLRFRGREEMTASLRGAGFQVRAVRDAPDRRGLEFVFLAQRGPVPHR
jgi:SAM-dependent methyltransferase